MSNNLLIIFVTNTDSKDFKPKIVAEVGLEKAKRIHYELMDYTAKLVKDLPLHKAVYYSQHLEKDTPFKEPTFLLKAQGNGDLGSRLMQAFNENFSYGYRRIIVICSDCVEISEKDISEAFILLSKKDVVIGPSKDGGYYLLGLTAPFNSIFEEIPWNTPDVFKKTYLEALANNKRIVLLEEKTAIQSLDDWQKKQQTTKPDEQSENE